MSSPMPTDVPDNDIANYRALVHRKLEEAVRLGTLHVTRVRSHVLYDGGVPFLVHQALEKRHKPKNHAPLRLGNQLEDPFATPDPTLLVEQLSDTHRVLLNKYPVLHDHLLLVTNQFAPQTSALDKEDFDAVIRLRRKFDALVFYNSGPVAGASQAHKHLQAIPLPIGQQPSPLPLWPAEHVDQPPIGEPLSAPQWPFRHVIFYLGISQSDIDATHLLQLYRRGLRELGSWPQDLTDPAPYNLLLARSWLWLVPRVRERFEKISINSLGFAGSFYAKNDKRLSKLRTRGPMEALRWTAGAR